MPTSFFKALPAVFLILSTFSVPAYSGTEPAFQGDAFVTASIAEPSNLIPFLASDSASAGISRLIFNGLLKYDKNLKLTGDLADSWDVSEDGLVIVFHLKENVRWQDGEPFTSKDVVFTFKKLTDPATPTPYGSDFERVQSLEAPDDYTVRVIYKEPFSPGLASWSMGIVPEHILKNQNLLQTTFARKPVGTGPYMLKKWVSGEKIELVANPAYFDSRPNIDRYVYRIIPDQSTQFLELETGNLDEAALTPLQFSRQTATPFFDRQYVKFKLPSFAYTYLGYNLQNPLFSDKNVRRAIGMAIDKKEIIAVTLMGYGRPATGPFLPDSWASDPAVPVSPFDPAASRLLLAQAGWEDRNKDGILEKDGRPFSFTVLTNQGNDERKKACEIIQRRLREVGIDMKIRIVEWSAFLREFIDKKNFEAVVLAWHLSPDPDVYDIFHSSKTRAGEFNFISYKNAKVDELLEKGRSVFGENERAVIYKELHRLIAEEEPYTFLYVPEALSVLHRRFRGVELSPSGIGHNFIRWYVPPIERKYPAVPSEATHG